MSKNDITINAVIELNRIIESVVGFRDLIPEGTDHDSFNLFIRSSLEKIEFDLREVVKDLL